MYSITGDDQDSDPEEPGAVGLLFVPTRPGPAGVLVIRLMQTAVGTQTAVGFTTRKLLSDIMGPEQKCLLLSLSALRTMIHPLGIALVTVDPLLTAPSPERVSESFIADPRTLLTDRPAPRPRLDQTPPQAALLQLAAENG